MLAIQTCDQSLFSSRSVFFPAKEKPTAKKKGTPDRRLVPYMRVPSLAITSAPSCCTFRCISRMIPLIHLIVVRPSFITKPRNRTVIEKEPVSFYCNASGNPVPTITWVKDGKTVGTTNTLRFQTTWRYQSGRYWCLAQNGLNVTINASADLNVQCK